MMNEEPATRHEQFLRHYSAHEPAIRAFVRRLVPLRTDVPDVMQEVALVLWKKFENLPDPDDFRRWAFGVAKFEALAWLRDKRRDRLVFAEDVLEQLAQEATALEPVLDNHRAGLEACLEELPAEHRGLVLSAYEPGARIQDIAERSRRTVGGFYQWLHRVRLQLLDCVRRGIALEGAK
jgi:RNA polymerase sigma-70 factor (ECF subfamily)